jgi:nucleolar protein 53
LIQNIALQETHLAELAEGLPVPGQEEVKEELDSSDSEYRALNPPVKNRKKTRQQRRRLKEAHVEMLKKEANKVEKKKLTDINE